MREPSVEDGRSIIPVEIIDGPQRTIKLSGKIVGQTIRKVPIKVCWSARQDINIDTRNTTRCTEETWLPGDKGKPKYWTDKMGDDMETGKRLASHTKMKVCVAYSYNSIPYGSLHPAGCFCQAFKPSKNQMFGFISH